MGAIVDQNWVNWDFSTQNLRTQNLRTQASQIVSHTLCVWGLTKKLHLRQKGTCALATDDFFQIRLNCNGNTMYILNAIVSLLHPRQTDEDGYVFNHHHCDKALFYGSISTIIAAAWLH